MKRWALALALLGSLGCGKEKEAGTPPADTRTPDPSVSEADLASATAIALNTPADGKLADPTQARAFFKFLGKAGEFLSLSTRTQNDRYDPTYVDTIVTLYDANRVRLARSDDAWPRLDNGNSLLLTRIPADGTYYVSVGGCATVFGTDLCGDGKDTTHLEFQFTAASNLFADAGAIASAQQDGTKAKADAIRYKAAEGGDSYVTDYIAGAFTQAGQTQVFSYTPPANIFVREGLQAWSRFWVTPVGADEGNGSTASIKLWVEDGAGNKLSEADQSNYGIQSNDTTNAPLLLTVPITLGQPYFLFVQSTATTSRPETDFYVMSHWDGQWLSVPENEVGDAGSNDTSETAEPYLASFATAKTAAVIGNLATESDVDWFVLEIPEGFTQIRDFCYAQRYGSGLRGFTAAYLAEDASGAVAELPTLAYTEVANADPRRLYQTVPEGTVKVRARFSATSVDPQVQGRFYSCSLYFK